MKAVAAVAALTVGSPAWAGTTVLPVPLDGCGSSVAAGPYRLDLGEGSNGPNPPAWEGPVRIRAPNGTACTVSDDVAIVEPPLNLVNGHLLYFSTYSGSTRQVFVVDADTCAVRWIGTFYSGAAQRIIAGRLIMKGEGGSGRRLRPLTINAAGLPAG